MTRAVVFITRRPEIADPQGSTVRDALVDLGFSDVRSVRLDRTIYLEVDGNPVEVEAKVTVMCDRLLANPVLEDYRIQIDQ